MPGFDGTGPEGQGPKTGRGDGNCKPRRTQPAQPSPNRPRRPRKGQGRRPRRGLMGQRRQQQ